MTTKSKQVSEVQTDGKSFIVMRADGSSLFRVGLQGGGVVPEDLKGFFTTTKVAEQAIHKYLSERG